MVATTTQSFPRGKKAPVAAAAVPTAAGSSKNSTAKKRKLDGAASSAPEVDEDADTGADALFGKKAAARAVSDSADASKKKTKSSSKKPKLTKPESKDKEPTAAVVTFKALRKGNLLFGCVRQINENELLISLPNKLNGVVTAAECSDEFATHFANAAAAAQAKRKPGKPTVAAPGASLGASSGAGDDSITSLAPLRELFTVGQFVPCVVLSTAKEAKGKQINLSLRTSLVHAELVPATVTKGMALHATIHSVEDHGAVVNLGVRGLTAFVPRTHLGTTDKSLQPGQHVLATVLSLNAHTSTATVTLDRSQTIKTVTRGDAFTLKQLVPGMLLNVRVDDVLANGLSVNFLTFFNGTVEQNHMSHPCQRGWADAYKKGLKGRARIISLDFVTKSIMLSMAPHVVHLATADAAFAVGDIVEKATIERIDEGIGMLLSLQSQASPAAGADADAMDVDDDNEDADANAPAKATWKTFTPAYVHISNVSDARVDKLEKAYSVGALIACRVIGAAPFDGVVNVSCKASSLSQKVLRHADLQAGEKVSGTILAVEPWGMLLELSEGVRGLVSPQHVPPFVVLSKAGNAATSKKHDATGKYRIGKKVTARVLRVDSVAKKTYLTMKKALLTSELPPLATYTDATIGRTAHGVITKIADYGVIVSFYNGVYGLVPAALLREAGVTVLEDAYVLGQVVKAIVTRCDEKKQRLMLSFNVSAASTKPALMTAAAAAISDLVGQTITNVTVLNVDATCLRVQTADGLDGVVPFVQLTDFPRATALVDALVAPFAAGDVLETPLLVVSQAVDGVLTLSQKPLLLQFANDKRVVPRAFSDVVEHATLVGYVASVHATKGVFIKFLNNVTALAPKAFLTDAFVSTVDDGLFEIGETVVCSVSKVDATKQQFVVSFRHMPTSIKTLPTFVGAFASACVRALPPPAVYALGHTEKAEFVSMRPYGAVFVLDKHDVATTVIVPAGEDDDEDAVTYTEGDRVKLLLVDYDVEKRVYYATADPTLVASGAKKSRKQRARVVANTTVAAATVVAISANELYAIVTFPDAHDATHLHCGVLQLADFPSPSQTSSKLGVDVGNVVACRITAATTRNSNATSAASTPTPFDDLPLLVREADELLTKTKSSSRKKTTLTGFNDGVSLPKYRTSDDLALGALVTGRIVVIKEHSIEIKLKASKACGKVVATVSIVDVDDAPAGTTHPFDAFSINMVVTGRVLAVMQKGTNQRKAVSDTNPPAYQALHLSLRQDDVAADRAVHDLVRADWDAASAGRVLLTPGQQVDGVVVEQSDDALSVRLSHRVVGSLSALELSRDVAELQDFRARFPVGKRVRCTILAVDTDRSRVDLSLIRTAPLSHASKELQPGSVVLGQLTTKVAAVKAPSLMVRLSAHVYGRVCVTELLPQSQWQHAMLALPQFSAGTFVQCVVLSSSSTNSSNNSATTNIDLSLRSDALTDPHAYVQSRLPSMVVGDLVPAIVTSTTTTGCFVRVHRNVAARVLLRDLSDAFVTDPQQQFAPGTFVTGRVTKQTERGLELTLKASIVSTDASHGASLVTLADLQEGAIVKGTITKVQPYGVFVQLDKSVVSGLCHISEVADERVTSALDAVFTPGDYVKAKILKIQDRRVSLGLKPSYFADEDASESESDDEESDEETMEVDEEEEVDSSSSSSSEEEEEEEEAPVKTETTRRHATPAAATVKLETTTTKTPVKTLVKLEKRTKDDDDSSDDDEATAATATTAHATVAFAWDGFANVLAPVASTTTRHKTTQMSQQQTHNDKDARTTVQHETNDSDSDSDSDDAVSNATTASTALTRASSSSKPTDEWIALREKALAQNAEAPQSVDAFERLIATTPQSSFVWIQYMAFYVALTEIALARDVATRATTAVSFRDEIEKRNVWVAFLNLEHDFGDDASFLRVFDSAVRVNHPKRIYLELVALYVRANELDDVAATLTTMQKKFRTSKQVWLCALQFYVKQSAFDKAAETLQRALQSLAPHKHLPVILKYGQLLFEAGQLEKARTIFEGVLATYPKRLDLWNVYIDKEIKCGGGDGRAHNVDLVRSLFQRLLAMDFSAKKMKFLFQKFVAFEQVHGDDAGVEHVKQLAKDFVAQAAAAGGN